MFCEIVDRRELPGLQRPLPPERPGQRLDENLSDAADLAGTAIPIAAADDNKLQVLDIFRPAVRYVRAVVTRGTADAVFDGVFAVQYGPLKGPVTQDATVAGSRRGCRRGRGRLDVVGLITGSPPTAPRINA
ncbi:hypothetical protein [Methylobrevis albus]|uniref:Uncharacterized protein n=1 Tax=Methylobrevis albus TaxID=2793297 RepID=A0A931I400_9HYPH|nr:hypothetical protein [Methylobrevis albus]MBH0239054.1 hypothetical protein [Methylobrevis albus]